MKKLILAIIIGMSFSANAEWTTSHKIKTLKAQGNGVWLVLDGFVNSNDTILCDTSTTPATNTNTFFMQKEAADYDTRISFLLSAYMQQQNIKMSYYTCSSVGNYLNIGSVQLSTDFQ